MPRAALLAIRAVSAVCLLGVAACGGDGPAGVAEPGAAKVTSVTDGDTLRVAIAGRTERVRLIGIDTPETHGRGGLRECFGKEATDQLRRLVPPGTDVRLVRDVEARDRYGRLLAYVYRGRDKLFVNLAMAQSGHAAAYTFPPNVAHADERVAAAGDAREAGRGLWAACGGPDSRLP